MIILATTVSLVNQMPVTWQGIYTWLRKNYPEVHLVTWDICDNIVFEGQIKVYLNNGNLVAYFDFNFDFTIVNIVIEQGPVEEDNLKIELCNPDSLDKIQILLANHG